MLRQESAGRLWPNDRDDFKAVPFDALGAWILLLVLEIVVVGKFPDLHMKFIENNLKLYQLQAQPLSFFFVVRRRCIQSKEKTGLHIYIKTS